MYAYRIECKAVASSSIKKMNKEVSAQLASVDDSGKNVVQYTAVHI